MEDADVCDVVPSTLGRLGNAQERAIVEKSVCELTQRAAQYHANLVAEIRPQGTLAAILVAQLSRDAAGLDFAAEAEAATVRFAAKNRDAAQLFGTAEPTDRPLLGAISSGLVMAASRFLSKHQRSFFAALRELREISRQPQAAVDLTLFPDEEFCLAYLVRWQQDQSWKCSACGGHERYFLPSRAVFECPCGRQLSPREGTIFAASKIPLIAWFQVAQSQLIDPQMPSSKLAQSVNVVRQATLRKMVAKVAAALASPKADQLLAGLPNFVTGHLRQVYGACQTGSRSITRGRPLAVDGLSRQPARSCAGTAAATAAFAPPA